MTVSFSLDQLSEARSLVARYVPPTPQYAWPLLGEALGAEVWVKHENYTPTGAFKMRGGLVYVDRYVRRASQPSPLIAATRGNHGQSVAFAGRVFGLGVSIVMPHGNSPDKNDSMRALGATLIEHGHDFQAAVEHARLLAEERELHMVPSFHPDLVLGVATYAHELFTGAPELDAVYVPVGLGSGICGLIGVRDLLGLRTEIIGVVSERAPATALSFAARRPITTDSANTFMDGVACRTPDPVAIETIVKGAARIVEVSDDLGAEAVRVLYRTTHSLPEPAGATALAGLLSERDLQRGKRVAVVISGGNMDAPILAQILAGQTPTV